jgi:hypothetical protein
MTLQWRTRAVEEETGFIARFAWNTALTPEQFYREMAGHAFGPESAATMGAVIGELQRLGSHWTGVRGTGECSRMVWTGRSPHLPFDLDETAPRHLLPKAEAAVEALSLVPPDSADPQSGAFHLQDTAADASLPRDASRLGVRTWRSIAERLRRMRDETDEEVLRMELGDILDIVWDLRPKLVAAGMSSASYRAVDEFIIAIHHLLRNAGASRKMPALRRLRRRVSALRDRLEASAQTHRLERVDYLLATMDFVLHYDAAAMQLAHGEYADGAIDRAERARAAGRHAEAAAVAAEAYEHLAEAGIREAVRALARRLTVRCDFGVLATFNVKPLPLYWQTFAALEAFLPAVGPRQISVRGRAHESWISWTPSDRAAGHNVYRRKQGSRRWLKVNRDTLSPSCAMFIDRPTTPGWYEYAVSAVDAEGAAGPRSHAERTYCGTDAPPARIVAPKPRGRLAAGQPLEQRVAVLSERELAEVAIVYRHATSTRWLRVPMLPAFRDTYAGMVPAGDLESRVVAFYVEAIDTAGRAARWPDSAPEAPWSLVVM